MSLSVGETPDRAVKNAHARAPLARFFYLGIALVIALAVIFGFGSTVESKLFHPTTPVPRVVYVHAVVFTAWVILLITQSSLVLLHRVVWHRRLGLFAIALGVAIPILGLMTAVAMTRRNRALGMGGGEEFLIVQLFDMLAFTVCFALALHWRRRPEYHRRLMLMATCALSVAAFSRLPNWLVPHMFWYPTIDLLMFMGAVRDWLVLHRVHPVYLYGLPAMVVGQLTALLIYKTGAPAWVAIASWILN
jgi:hypothetical protein